MILNKKDSSKYPYVFLLFYGFMFMASAIYSTFMPIFLDSKAFNKTSIGTLLSIGPFIAIFAQPLWGIASDRSKYKNNILIMLLITSSFIVLLFNLSNNFYYLLFIMIIFTFFQISTGPLSDTITLEYLDSTKWSYGPIRMIGTVGFAVMAAIAGKLVNKNINGIFIIYFILTVMAIVVSFYLPKVKGHQAEKKRVSVLVLLKNTDLTILLSFNLIISIMSTFFGTFFPIYFKQMGADNAMLGWAIFISAISEIPFLIFADRIIRKISIQFALVGSAVVAASRWFILYFISNPYIVLPLQLLHGLTFIVFAYSLAIYINQKVPPELKASGQALNALLSFGVARIIGGMLEGFLSDKFGIQNIILCNSLLTFGASAIFSIIFLKRNLKQQ